MPAEPDGLVANVDATLMEQIFDVPKRKREAHVKHYHLADDFWARLKVAEWGAFCYPGMLRNRPARLKLLSSDKAVMTVGASPRCIMVFAGDHDVAAS